jgi:hypothetical protein
LASFRPAFVSLTVTLRVPALLRRALPVAIVVLPERAVIANAAASSVVTAS